MVELPEAVVYPFGGGDLLSALAAYPDAAEYTTLSLELAGHFTGMAFDPALLYEAEIDDLRASRG